ncbi:hypothetical protein [Martelella alba]|uniref:Uncharacterized protein n=1 Tax=Martelella alba TaxID=2590451 RepID=A0ABY2SQH2_9HYPH|nr:hypothetical protein [Martelella alba]TKI08339.1 hypothetical protein FCN80_04130 [Martelella alba]
MRYYDIRITDGNGKQLQQFTSLLANGNTNPAAQLVELDIPLYPMATPMGSAFVKIWGVGIDMLSQASNFNGMNIQIFAGMAAGLPLADPSQSGLVLQGTIQQAFGNWQGVNQTLDMIVNPSGGTPASPKNIVINWKKGALLATAIKNTLATAFPDYSIEINISSSLVLSHDAPGFYATISQFAAYVKQVSQSIITTNYSGVDIIIRPGKFVVYDGTTAATPRQLKFTDLIGQPTWIENQVINLTCVMRADINVGDYIKLPPGAIATTQASSYSQYRQSSIFQGTFQVQRVRLVGNSRQPDGNAWVTVIDAGVSTS